MVIVFLTHTRLSRQNRVFYNGQSVVHIAAECPSNPTDLCVCSHPTESFLYDGLLEMADLDLFPHADQERTGCPVFHLFPRFVRDLAGESDWTSSPCLLCLYRLDRINAV